VTPGAGSDRARPVIGSGRSGPRGGRGAAQVGPLALAALLAALVLALGAVVPAHAEMAVRLGSRAVARRRRWPRRRPRPSTPSSATPSSGAPRRPAASVDEHPRGPVVVRERTFRRDVYVLWPEAPGADVDADLPVVRRHEPDEPPVPPYETVTHRVRASEVTGLRALVDLRSSRSSRSILGRARRLRPARRHHGALRMVAMVHNQRLGAAPGVLRRRPLSGRARLSALARVAPPAALDVASRPPVRRPHGRRPADDGRRRRHGVGHLAGRLGAGPGSDRLVGGDLATWPLVLFPPLLYVAAIGLELTSDSHRVAWGWWRSSPGSPASTRSWPCRRRP